MSAIPQTTGWQAGFLQVLPAVQTHAQIQFRSLPAAHRQEAIQEAIASACVSYRLLAARGKLETARPGTLADYAVKFVRNGRHVGGKQDGARDVLSPVAQRRHGVRVTTLHTTRGTGETDGWRQSAVESRGASIPDLAAFRIDFAHWLRTLTRRHRRVIAALAAGETTSTVAARFDITAGRVSQLRRKFEREWQVFQGECGVATG